MDMDQRRSKGKSRPARPVDQRGLTSGGGEPARWPGRIRRSVDIAVGTLALVALLPLLLTLAVVVRVSSGRPVLYQQVRVGEGCRIFTLYKFRSMRPGSAGPEITSVNDARITSVGRVLRRTGVDELPQLLNLVRGDMTLVGPRPETPRLADRYPAQFRWVFAYRPGLTGPVQLTRELAECCDDVDDPEGYYLSNLVPRRVALDADYLLNPSVARTASLLLRTAGYVLVSMVATAMAGLSTMLGARSNP